jgi:hypothetical protein
MSCFVDAPFVLRSGDGQAGELATLYLTITVSANAPPRLMLPTNATEMDVSPMNQATEPTIARAQDTTDTTPFVTAITPEPLSPPMDHLPVETSNPIPPVPDIQVASPAENALHDANEATKAIDLTSTWEGAVERIKWVIDTVSPVAGVRHSAMSFTSCLTEPTSVLSLTRTHRWPVACYWQFPRCIDFCYCRKETLMAC